MDTRYKFIMKMAAIIAVLTLGLHLLAIQFYLYWVFAWFDILMHFLGGLFLGFFTYGFFTRRFNWFEKLPAITIFAIVTSLVIVLGFTWEVFEFYLGSELDISLQPSLNDTIADLFFDTTGALVAVLISYLHVKKTS